MQRGESHTITAQYVGTAKFASSTSATPISEVVIPANTLTVLSTSHNPVAAGDPVTFRAIISPDIATNGSATGRDGFFGAWGEHGQFCARAQLPSGTVAFMDGTTLLGTATLSHGMATFTTSTLSETEVHNITAVYQGDGNYNTSTSQVVQQSIGAAVSATKIRVTYDRPVIVDTAQDFSVTVKAKTTDATATPVIPTGTVTFVDATVSTSTPLTGSPVTLDATGTATFSTTFTTPGLHLLVATYTPDATSGLASSQTFVPVFVKATDSTTTEQPGDHGWEFGHRGWGSPHGFALQQFLASAMRFGDFRR